MQFEGFSLTHTAGKNTVEWKHKYLHPEKHNLMQQNRLVSVWRAAFQEGSWWTRVNLCPCHKDSGIPGCIRKSTASRLRWSLTPAQGCEGGLQLGASFLWGKVEKDGTVQPGKERSWEEFIHLYPMEGRKEDTGIGYPDRLWSPSPWRHPKPDLTWPWANSSCWLCFEPRANLNQHVIFLK